MMDQQSNIVDTQAVDTQAGLLFGLLLGLLLKLLLKLKSKIFTLINH